MIATFWDIVYDCSKKLAAYFFLENYISNIGYILNPNSPMINFTLIYDEL